MLPDFHPIVPAAACFSPDGTLHSPDFDDVYASAQGALAQARHVFLDGNDLPQRWHKSDAFTVVETGFGAGLNFLATWRALRESSARAMRLHFVSVDKHPIKAEELARIHARFPELRGISMQLRERYPPLLPGAHRLHFDGGRVTLTLLFGDAAVMLRQLRAGADAYFLDGFAPAKNPQMWSAAVFAELARMANPGATFATYTVAAAVVHGLTYAGFSVEKRAGFGHKREMLCGRYSQRVAAEPVRRDKRAVVIGAGLAGTACAQRLAERGWSVQLLERNPAAALEASGNPAGLVRPVFSLDWNTHSRFTSAAFLYACRHQAALDAAGTATIHGRGGVLQLARDAHHLDKQQRIIEQFALQADLVKVVLPREAAELAGAPVAGPACWFPEAMWADPASMCRSNLEASGGMVNCLFGRDVAALRRNDHGWEILDGAGGLLGSAPVVVLANACMATRFGQAVWLPLRPVRGQVSLMRERPGHDLKIAVCREGYVTPALNGMHCIGATFNEDTPDRETRNEDHVANLRRLDAMLPGFGDDVTAHALGGRVAFRAMSFDRLPVLGALPDPQSPESNDDTGLFACLGLGSRGMTWAALAAEIVASRIAGEAMPVEAGLLDALDPARFLENTHVAALPRRRRAGKKPAAG
ncbi:MAG: bifunctional tRNA (5-methylaminomethyl-2-thiouridine)(34)-methyltransferase MnmD/FAD-dependent 5-carboxymethylaminomethyl-2-thiouridine(34) oxidoreductase MnmC [Betaproteobacteria bacterium]